VSGVLASYGVLLISLVEETEVSLRETLWTPVTYIMSCCLAGKANFSALVATCFALVFFLGLLFDSEAVGDIFLRNIGRLSTDYRALYSRRHNSLYIILLEAFE
jgi:hypothetical protein